jgi:leucyl aminopeptidase
MRSRSAFALVGASLVWLVAGAASAANPAIVVKGDRAALAAFKGRLLFVDGDLAVVKRDPSDKAELRDLYVVNLGRAALPADMSRLGEVVFHAPGRFALVRAPQASVEALAAAIHQQSHRCGPLLALTGEPMSDDAVASPTPLIPVEGRDARVQALTAKVDADNIRAIVTEMSDIHTRFHNTSTGQSVPAFLAEKYEALRGDRADVTITKIDHGTRTRQNSLVVRIEGTTRPDEVLVLGSHIDSVNWDDGTSERAPGADDNASGTATNLEIFRILMQEGIRPERTIEIHGYAAEEIGLVGSADIAARYKRQGVKVVAMVQHDMDLYKASGNDKLWFVTNGTDAGFNASLAQLADHYSGIERGSGVLTGGDSDHTSWKRNGYASAFPFENPQGDNPNIHTADDDIAHSGAFGQAAGFARLGLAYLAHFGGLSAGE